MNLGLLVVNMRFNYERYSFENRSLKLLKGRWIRRYNMY